MPVCFHLDANGVVLGARKKGCKPVGQQTQLTHKQRKVLCRYEFIMTDGSKFSHAWRRLNGDFEIFMFMEIVGKGCDRAQGMWFNNDVHKLKLGPQCVETVGHP